MSWSSSQHALDERTEAEVLGAILISPSLHTSCTLRPRDLFWEGHRIAFEAVAELAAQNRLTLGQLRSALQHRKRWEAVGGDTFGSALIDAGSRVRGPIEFAARVQQVAERAVQRRVHRLACALETEALSVGPLDHGDWVVSVTRRVLEAVTHRDDGLGLVPYQEVMRQTVEAFDSIRDGSAPIVPTAIPDLDRKLNGGMWGGRLVILAARPRVGKSALAQQIAEAVAALGRTVAFFQLEMGAEQMGLRSLAEQIGSGQLYAGTADRERVVLEAERRAALPLWIDDRDGLSTAQMEAECLRLHAHTPLGMVVIDYAQRARATRGDTEVERLGEVSRWAAGLAKRMRIPVLALCQLNRGIEYRGKNAWPKISDIKGSGQFEQDAATILTLHREALDDNELSPTTRLFVLKNRDGKGGIIDLYFDGDHQRFRPGVGPMEQQQETQRGDDWWDV